MQIITEPDFLGVDKNHRWAEQKTLTSNFTSANLQDLTADETKTLATIEQLTESRKNFIVVYA